MPPNQTKPIPAKILLVDDIPANLDILSHALEPEGYQISVAPNGEIALKIACGASPDLILLDVMMPGLNGFETCRRLKEDESTADIPVIFVTAKDETASLIEGFHSGGVDYIQRPFETEELLVRVENHLKINRLTQQLLEKNRELQQEIAKREQAEDNLKTADERFSLISEQEAKRWGIASFIGKSKTIGKILTDIRRLHHTAATNVLIAGESGTGKELIARAIHFGGPRAEGAFIAVNCSAIPSELAESLFFGHVKGAFTGATTDKKGYFELADGGTLFLDEIGDMALDMQSKLLRVLEDGYIMPIAARQPKKVDVRILSATNTDLQKQMAEGKFRMDLYHRLAVFPVFVPPLRQRKEDIPLLAEHFLNLFATEMGMPTLAFNQEALLALESYSFPGNVRELKNIIERALIESGGETIQPEHLHFLPATAGNNLNKNHDLDILDIKEHYLRMAEEGESFWQVVHAPFLARELNRSQIKAIIQTGLEKTQGSYKALLPLFGISESDYHKFMDFLRHHQLKPSVS